MAARKKYKRLAKNLKNKLSTKPIKKVNKKIVLFVTKRPYQSITFATLLSTLAAGLAYYKFKHLIGRK